MATTRIMPLHIGNTVPSIKCKKHTGGSQKRIAGSERKISGSEQSSDPDPLTRNNHTEKDETVPQGIRAEKSPNSAGTSHPCFSEVKNRY